MIISRSNNKVMVIAAHSDDEALGCSGTLFKHRHFGDEIAMLFMTDGVSSRSYQTKEETKKRLTALSSAVQLMGCDYHKLFSFPDNAMDSIPFIDIVKSLEESVKEFQPTIIYTHFGGDLNIDHKICYQAVMTACRPLPSSKIRAIHSFEVLSSTEWSTSSNCTFVPNYYVNIEDYLDDKIAYLKCYDEEMREFPHARSYENVCSLAKYRGASVGIPAAEAFVTSRIIDF